MDNLTPENQAVIMVRNLQAKKITGPEIAKELLKHFDVNITCSALDRQFFIISSRDNRIFVSEEAHIDNTFTNTLVVIGGFDSFNSGVEIPKHLLG